MIVVQTYQITLSTISHLPYMHERENPRKKILHSSKGIYAVDDDKVNHQQLSSTVINTAEIAW